MLTHERILQKGFVGRFVCHFCLNYAVSGPAFCLCCFTYAWTQCGHAPFVCICIRNFKLPPSIRPRDSLILQWNLYELNFRATSLH